MDPAIPPPEDALIRASIFAAAGILGSLYAEAMRVAAGEKFDPDRLRALAGRVGREGMQASRRLKKAADGSP